jgi:O-succinylbenzoate synthase
MKIDQIILTHVRVPLTEPFKISNGEITEKDAILVGVHSEGLVGYGESSPMSGHSIRKKHRKAHGTVWSAS